MMAAKLRLMGPSRTCGTFDVIVIKVILGLSSTLDSKGLVTLKHLAVE